MPSVEISNFLNEEHMIINSLVIILVTASAVSLLFQRLRLAVIPAYIVAGVISGPFGFSFVESAPAIDGIAHLAIVLLLFSIGMELHLSSLKSSFLKLFFASFNSIFISLILIWPLCSLYGLNNIQSFTIAMALCLSSTAVVLRILSLKREMTTSHGHLSLAILVTQDLAALAMIALIPVLSSSSQINGVSKTSDFIPLVKDTILMIIGMTFLVIIARRIIPFIVRESLKDQSGELSILTGVAISLLMAYLSQMLGFSLEMGAFIAGFVLTSSPFRFELSSRINILRDLFMAIFFTTLGMKLNLNVVTNHLPTILIGTLALLFIKTISISLSSFISGITARLSLRVGLNLSQAGEFSLILLTQSLAYKIIDETTSSIIISIVILSLILTPTIIHYSRAISLKMNPTLLAPWFKKPWRGERQENKKEENEIFKVIIAGFGPLGKHLATNLSKSGVSYVVVELNPKTVKREREKNRSIVFGDISSSSLLSSLNIKSSIALALTFPDPKVSMIASSIAKSLSPDIYIIARSPTGRNKKALLESGVDKVVVDEDEAATKIFSSLSKIYSN